MKIVLNVEKKHLIFFGLVLVLFFSGYVIATGWTSTQASHPTLYTDTIRAKSDSKLVNVNDNLKVTGNLEVTGTCTGCETSGGTQRGNLLFNSKDEVNNNIFLAEAANRCADENCKKEACRIKAANLNKEGSYSPVDLGWFSEGNGVVKVLCIKYNNQNPTQQRTNTELTGNNVLKRTDMNNDEIVDLKVFNDQTSAQQFCIFKGYEGLSQVVEEESCSIGITIAVFQNTWVSTSCGIGNKVIKKVECYKTEYQ